MHSYLFVVFISISSCVFSIVNRFGARLLVGLSKVSYDMYDVQRQFVVMN